MSSQRPPRSIGDRELALLQFISAHRDVTVAEAVEGFAAPNGLARSTVLTMMERLRQKGHLARRQVDGVYRYAPRTAPSAAVRQAVHSFVERTLGGSVAPFVAYLSERSRLSAEEIAELEMLLARLERERKAKR
jgi:predicted transcriptional regulator